jgi:hypothetical protein
MSLFLATDLLLLRVREPLHDGMIRALLLHLRPSGAPEDRR